MSIHLLWAIIAIAASSTKMSYAGSERIAGFERPGKLVSIGHHALHIHCLGDGKPTIILEAGIGGNYLDWIKIQRRTAKFTKVCSYDRTGYGWSEAGPKPRTISVIIAELEQLLTNVGLIEPVILVGHSFGGLSAFNLRQLIIPDSRDLYLSIQCTRSNSNGFLRRV